VVYLIDWQIIYVSFFELHMSFSALCFGRITESQNGLSWKGPATII